MKNSYRPEIDGLRTIAVISVIIYHAEITINNIKLFQGGFIGVDIFFVISGYLITSIILNELIDKNSFSFKNFYERRIRRILPTLLFVILISIPIAWVKLSPNDFLNFSKSALYSLGFSSNIFFWYSGQQYEAESALLLPLLHTWSLSVEEQFYIFFPIILVFVFKYFKKYLIHILIFGFVVSLIFADWASGNHPNANFYFLPTRGWELLAGSILAHFETSLGYRSKNNKLNLILPGVGILLICYSYFLFDHNTFHPSFYTLIPIIGTCLVIWYSDKNEFITKILSTNLFVKIGLISYSLYLWHYPIFALGRIKNLNHSEYDKISWIIITIICSIISYFLIEKPSRKKIYKFKSIFISILFIFLIIATSLFYLNFKNKKDIIKSGDHGFSTSPNQLIGKGNKKFIIFGDSHATHSMGYLKDFIFSNEEKDLSFYNVTHTACISLPSITNYVPKGKKKFKLNKECINLYKNINQILKSTEKEPVVFLYNTWFKNIIKNNSKTYNENLFFSNDMKKNKIIIKAILDDIIKLRRMNNIKKKWIIIGISPGSYNYEYNGYMNCYYSNRSKFNLPIYEIEECDKTNLKKNGSNFENHQIFKNIVNSEYDNELVYVDTYELYCNENYCNNFTSQKKLIYDDHHHFTYEGSKKLFIK